MICGVSDELRYTHLFVFEEDAGIFASARNKKTGRLELFLIMGTEEKAYRKNGGVSRWEQLEQKALKAILQSICQAVSQGQLVFKINGLSNRVINRNN